MNSLDQQVLQQMQRWLVAGQSCWLCTIVATVGASPRPVGSLLGCNERDVVGSLSGGCVEDDLLGRLRNGQLIIDAPQIIEYGVSAEENERLGLPCGGRLHVLVEKWSPRAELVAQLAHWLDELQQRHVIERRLDLRSGFWQLNTVEKFAPLLLSLTQLIQCYGPRFQLLLIGAGEVARCLAQMAQLLDYRIIVCDPRPQLIEQWSLPGVELLCCMPDDAVRAHCRDDRHSIVITLTHDPRIDDMALMEALQTELFYVGALGSQRTSEKRRQRLLQLDLTGEQVARLHAPVGLNIGSKRPPEIAIAILAELTQMRSEEMSEARGSHS